MTDPVSDIPSVALALQGGSTHGAFTWGVLDRLLVEVAADRLRIAAISGTSAGAMNAAVTAAALMQGGAEHARQQLTAFWRTLSERGAAAGNALFGFAEPGLYGFNIDWNPAAIALEALSLVFAPSDNPFYTDALAPLLRIAFPGDALDRLNREPGPRLFLTAVNVATNARKIFSQPDITLDALRASACLPTEFKTVMIDGTPYWDGGYVGNPALAPLIGEADDVLLVMVNPLRRTGMPPLGARGILDRLNEITFNASVVLELNTIHKVNKLLRAMTKAGVPLPDGYKQVHLHLIRNDAFTATLGAVSKNSTSWSFLTALHDAGYQTAEAWLTHNRHKLGRESSANVTALTAPILKGQGTVPGIDVPTRSS